MPMLRTLRLSRYCFKYCDQFVLESEWITQG